MSKDEIEKRIQYINGELLLLGGKISRIDAALESMTISRANLCSQQAALRQDLGFLEGSLAVLKNSSPEANEHETRTTSK